jgi:hypothetical protein
VGYKGNKKNTRFIEEVFKREGISKQIVLKKKKEEKKKDEKSSLFYVCLNGVTKII